MNDVRDILIELGYNPFDNGKEYRMRPIYRDSDNNTSLKVDKKTGNWIDFSEGISGKFDDLVKVTLGLVDKEQANKWLINKTGSLSFLKNNDKPTIKGFKFLDKSILSSLELKHDYWTKKGINEDVIKKFEGGEFNQKGKMSYRYCFPIFDSNRNLLGISGRDLLPSNPNNLRPKWKIIGAKKEFKYPLIYNYGTIKSKGEVILVESIGDCIALFNAGIYNVIVLFGVDLSIPLLNCLLKIPLNRIVISTNNDVDNNFVGNKAAIKISNTLLKYFDKEQVCVRLPSKNDFGAMNKFEIQQWHKELK